MMVSVGVVGEAGRHRIEERGREEARYQTVVLLDRLFSVCVPAFGAAAGTHLFWRANFFDS